MPVAWVDLFCGIGGVTSGAKQVPGVQVVLAVDMDCQALECYRRNHPGHRVEQLRLGQDGFGVHETVHLIRSAAKGMPVHLHASPPCQKLSQCNTNSADPVEGLRLVRWFFELVKALRPQTFSMENVLSADLENYLSEKGVPFARVDCSRHGCPQRRRRILAVSDPTIAQWLVDGPSAREVLPSDVLPHLDPTRHRLQNGSDNFPVRERQSDGTYKTVGNRPVAPGECSRSLHAPAHTVTRHPGKVYDMVDRSLRPLEVEEMAALQGFDADFDFSSLSASHAMLCIGNAVPPPLAQRLAQIVITRH